VDDRPHAGARWTLVRGEHRIRAIDGGGHAAEVAVVVE
jgi:hypothetical protein